MRRVDGMVGFDESLRAREARQVEPLETARGASVLYRLGDAIVVSRGRGHIDVPHLRHLMAYCDATLEGVPKIQVFHDWFAIDTYESQARKVMTPWALRTRDRHTAIHIGLRSTVVRMGVSVVAMTTDAPIRTYANLDELSRSLERALADHPKRA